MADKKNKADIPEKGKKPIPAPEECCEDTLMGEREDAASEEKIELQLLKEKFDELQDQHLRLMAEYDNYRKRSQREKDETFTSATAATLTKILPVRDNFERAAAFDCQSEDFRKGFELIEKSFSEMLTSFGVEPIGEVGEPFDPERHHAVMHIEDETLGVNVVSQVLQKGYKMGDRILRYAMVQTAN